MSSQREPRRPLETNMISLLMDQCLSQMQSSITLNRILERGNSTSMYVKNLRLEVLQWMIMDVRYLQYTIFDFNDSLLVGQLHRASHGLS